jgi:anthranilate synthase/aminodeoxychorismate synthase-like glutamine amidotransferase
MGRDCGIAKVEWPLPRGEFCEKQCPAWFNCSVVLLIDNYDSFSYNLVQALGALGADVEVVRNDAPIGRIEAMAPERIVISPGPKRPADAGVSAEALRRFAGRVPILGVCLGHQCIAEAFGGRVARAPRIMHGKTSPIHHDGAGLFRGIPNPFEAMRYHSLIVEELPRDFAVSARADRDEVMGIRHREWPLEGVQFHPESYRTPEGAALLKNFLAL